MKTPTDIREALRERIRLELYASWVRGLNGDGRYWTLEQETEIVDGIVSALPYEEKVTP